MSDFYEVPTTIHQLQGKEVLEAVKRKDAFGYDILTIFFTDGSCIRVQEEGQAGYFTYKLIGMK